MGLDPRSSESQRTAGPRSRARRLKNDLLYGLARVVLAVARRLPRAAGLALGAAVGWLAWLVARPERRRALGNVGHAYPRLPARGQRRLVRGAFVELGRCAFECLAIRPQDLDRVGGVDDAARAVLRDALAEGHGVVYVSAHYGNWELMAAAVARLAPVWVLARQSYDSRFTRLVENLRRAWGVRCLWVEQPRHLRQALRALQGGAIVGVLLDQPVRRGLPLDFFGRPALTSPVAAWLSRQSGAPLVAGFIRRAAGGRHEVRVARVAAPAGGRAAALHRATFELTGLIEQTIDRDPRHWAWSLDRWRSGPCEPPGAAAGGRW